MTLNKAGLRICHRTLCDEVCISRTSPSNIWEKMESSDCGLLFTLMVKFELLLVDLLYTHEPVTSEKILVILTIFYGITMNNKSTKENHHQHLKDKDQKDLQTSGIHIVPASYVRKCSNWVMFGTWYCNIHGSIHIFKAVNSESLSFLFKIFTENDFHWYQNKSEKWSVIICMVYSLATCFGFGMIIPRLVIMKICLFPVDKIRNWEIIMMSVKVSTYINKIGEIIYYRNHNNKLIPKCYLSLFLQFNTLFREVKPNSSGRVYICQWN